MTNMNPFDDNKNIDIPDFVEEKTDSDSIDMSIFKMPEEEIYDDVPKKNKSSKSKKRSNATLVLCLVLVGILLLTSIVALVYAVKEHKSSTAYQTELTQVKAKNKELQLSVDNLTAEVGELNKKIEDLSNAGTTVDPNKKYGKGTVLYITEDGQGMGIKEKASIDADFVDSSILDWGDKVVLVDDATKDADDNYWGKIDKGYIRIEYDGEIWASVEEQ